MAYQGFQLPTYVRNEVAPVTGSNTAVVAPYDWLVFTNPGTIAAQTVTLPVGPVDGQMVTVSNVAAITALTFSPAALGWANGSALAAGQGITLAFSSTFATPGWFVMAF